MNKLSANLNILLCDALRHEVGVSNKIAAAEALADLDEAASIRL